MLTLDLKDIILVKWWGDWSYAVHEGCKGHTDVKMSLVTKSFISTSLTQNFNTKSSTETVLVETNDCMSQILCNKYFLDEQGFRDKHILQQDNESAIKMEINGK